jgi:histidinol phosphatase-like PHP family hydrolase
MLRKNNVAAEINFHGNLPPAEFYRLCLKAGIKLTFGSDSHNLCDIGEFTPHLALLRSIGFNGDMNDILL